LACVLSACSRFIRTHSAPLLNHSCSQAALSRRVLGRISFQNSRASVPAPRGTHQQRPSAMRRQATNRRSSAFYSGSGSRRVRLIGDCRFCCLSTTAAHISIRSTAARQSKLPGIKGHHPTVRSSQVTSPGPPAVNAGTNAGIIMRPRDRHSSPPPSRRRS
jgi:hypothetical protein